MTLDKYVNLHQHSTKSLLDGMIKINELVDYTLELNQSASCITDHGVLFSIVDHFEYAEKKGQKAIAGFEAYVVKDHKIKEKSEAQSESDTRREHLILLAKNNDGYKKLMKICSTGTTDGFYYRPRIDDNVLKSIGTDGIIGSSACIAGRIAQHILKDRIEEAEKCAIEYFKLFNENFYLEIQPTMESSQIKVNQGLIELHKKLGIPLLATSDAHYLKRENAKTHDVLLAIQSKSVLSNPNRWRFPGDTFYVMSRNEIEQAFMMNGHEVLDQKAISEAIDNSVVIAEQCNVNFKWENYQLPIMKFDKSNTSFQKWVGATNKNEDSSADYLRWKCINGLKNKDNLKDDNGKIKEEYRQRIDMELDVITKMGYCDYFLVVEDIMRFCKENDVPVGPGRGCFKPDNVVSLSNNIKKKISDVEIGDKVISHDFKAHEVKNKLKYYINEEIININVSEKNINCTNDHKIYAIKKEDFDNGIRMPRWYEAHELNIGDYITNI